MARLITFLLTAIYLVAVATSAAFARYVIRGEVGRIVSAFIGPPVLVFVVILFIRYG